MESLYAYGFNVKATDKIYNVCIKRVSIDAERCAELFDFLLSMIPTNRDDLYKRYCSEFTEKLISCSQFELAQKFNERMLAVDSLNHLPYFNRVLINRRISNMVYLIEVADELLSDSDFKSAMLAYGEKYPDKENYYIQANIALKNASKLLSDKETREYVLGEATVTYSNLLSCVDIVQMQIEKYRRHKQLIKQKEEEEEQLKLKRRQIEQERIQNEKQEAELREIRRKNDERAAIERKKEKRLNITHWIFFAFTYCAFLADMLCGALMKSESFFVHILPTCVSICIVTVLAVLYGVTERKGRMISCIIFGAFILIMLIVLIIVFSLGGVVVSNGTICGVRKSGYVWISYETKDSSVIFMFVCFIPQMIFMFYHTAMTIWARFAH